MEIRVLPLSDLKPSPYNPRKTLKPGDHEYESLKRSISTFGLVEPIIWNQRSGCIVGGHQRLAVLADLGYQDAQVIVLDLDDTQEKTLNIALNKIHGDFDATLLKTLLEDLNNSTMDPLLTGFTSEELQSLLTSLGANAVDLQSEWKGLPEFVQEDLQGVKPIIVHFHTMKDREEFAKQIDQPITEQTSYLWFPKEDRLMNDEHYFDKPAGQNRLLRYPVYIVSKGRWKTRLTAKTFEDAGIPYSIVIEPQEFKEYAAVIDPKKILQLPFSNLGQGSIPARNWIYDHAVKAGAKKHWIFDDNIRGLYRVNRNRKAPVRSPVPLIVVEELSDRYTNVGLSGMHYFMFVPRKEKVPPFYLNTRVYSGILINHAIDLRWRGVYNEDTDLSLRVLKAGWCTILVNAFVIQKITTMQMAGGNTDELYKGDGRLKMAESLAEQHPDIVKVTRKFGRWQHVVNYSAFRENRLKLKPGVKINDTTNEFGLELRMPSVLDSVPEYQA